MCRIGYSIRLTWKALSVLIQRPERIGESRSTIPKDGSAGEEELQERELVLIRIKYVATTDQDCFQPASRTRVRDLGDYDGFESFAVEPCAMMGFVVDCLLNVIGLYRVARTVPVAMLSLPTTVGMQLVYALVAIQLRFELSHFDRQNGSNPIGKHRYVFERFLILSIWTKQCSVIGAVNNEKGSEDHSRSAS